MFTHGIIANITLLYIGYSESTNLRRGLSESGCSRPNSRVSQSSWWDVRTILLSAYPDCCKPQFVNNMTGDR